ncbi:MAG: hypothetical protein WBE41_15730, partial [Terracidiphilus sp.]
MVVAGAFQVAEKPIELDEIRADSRSGVKTPTHFMWLPGTDESVPFQNGGFYGVFPQPVFRPLCGLAAVGISEAPGSRLRYLLAPVPSGLRASSWRGPVQRFFCGNLQVNSRKWVRWDSMATVFEKLNLGDRQEIVVLNAPDSFKP